MSADPVPTEVSADGLVASGIEGLDHVLGGGFAPGRLYLIEGEPGTGKTTLAMRFLLEGARNGERVLCVTLSESAPELEAAAASHGWRLQGVTLTELSPPEEALQPESEYTIFHPSEVELGQTIQALMENVDRVQPSRLVVDAVSELRLLAGSALRFRRQILALKHTLTNRGCTVLLLDDLTASDRDLQVQSIAHGVLRLEHVSPEYGSDRRRLRVLKYRGMSFHEGYHDYVIRRGGLSVFPRLVAAEHRGNGRPNDSLSSGLTELDALLGGGLDRGTSTLVVGAAGAGKSTLASLFVWAAARRGETAAMFVFDESPRTLMTRAAGLGLDLEPFVASGRITLRSVDPAELSPGELAHAIRAEVEGRGAAIVVVDSINGYLNAMPDERFLMVQLHELLTYLGQHGVATLLIGTHQGLIGSQMVAPVDTSYLADAVVLLRYYEHKGEVRQALSVIKKRGGSHERTIRDFRLADGRIVVGEPLRDFRGVLTGVPTLAPREAEPR